MSDTITASDQYRDLSQLYLGFDKFDSETQHFLKGLAEIDLKIETMVFDEEGHFKIVEKPSDTSFAADIVVTIDTNEVVAETKKTNTSSKTQAKISTATKVALLVASGITLASIYKYSDQLVGVSTEDLKQQMQNVVINIKRPFEFVSEFARAQILGNEERLVCRTDKIDESCKMKSMKVTWTDAYDDFINQLCETKIVKGMKNLYQRVTLPFNSFHPGNDNSSSQKEVFSTSVVNQNSKSYPLSIAKNIKKLVPTKSTSTALATTGGTQSLHQCSKPPEMAVLDLGANSSYLTRLAPKNRKASNPSTALAPVYNETTCKHSSNLLNSFKETVSSALALFNGESQLYQCRKLPSIDPSLFLKINNNVNRNTVTA